MRCAQIPSLCHPEATLTRPLSRPVSRKPVTSLPVIWNPQRTGVFSLVAVYDGLIAIPNADSTKFYKNQTRVEKNQGALERVLGMQVAAAFVGC